MGVYTDMRLPNSSIPYLQENMGLPRLSIPHPGSIFLSRSLLRIPSQLLKALGVELFWQSGWTVLDGVSGIYGSAECVSHDLVPGGNAQSSVTSVRNSQHHTALCLHSEY